MCGSNYHTDATSGRIVGGDRSSVAQWPSVVLLHNRRLREKCTASIVSPGWLLASRTCVLGDIETDDRVEDERRGDWTAVVGRTVFEDDDTGVEVKRIVPFSGVSY